MEVETKHKSKRDESESETDGHLECMRGRNGGQGGIDKSSNEEGEDIVKERGCSEMRGRQRDTGCETRGA